MIQISGEKAMLRKGNDVVNILIMTITKFMLVWIVRDDVSFANADTRLRMAVVSGWRALRATGGPAPLTQFAAQEESPRRRRNIGT